MNSKNYFKAQKSAIFVKKDLKINMLKIKNNVELGTIIFIQENIKVLHVVYII